MFSQSSQGTLSSLGFPLSYFVRLLPGVSIPLPIWQRFLLHDALLFLRMARNMSKENDAGSF